MVVALLADTLYGPLHNANAVELYKKAVKTAVEQVSVW